MYIVELAKHILNVIRVAKRDITTGYGARMDPVLQGYVDKTFLTMLPKDIQQMCYIFEAKYRGQVHLLNDFIREKTHGGCIVMPGIIDNTLMYSPWYEQVEGGTCRLLVKLAPYWKHLGSIELAKNTAYYIICERMKQYVSPLESNFKLNTYDQLTVEIVRRYDGHRFSSQEKFQAPMGQSYNDLCSLFELYKPKLDVLKRDVDPAIIAAAKRDAVREVIRRVCTLRPDEIKTLRGIDEGMIMQFIQQRIKQQLI
jgi:hypothetical protein